MPLENVSAGGPQLTGSSIDAANAGVARDVLAVREATASHPSPAA